MQTSDKELSSTKSVLAAAIGDLLVAIIKTVAAILTGSSAMLSEAVHSFVDCTNEVLLLYGIRRSARKPDIHHPFGYGREVYFWSFVVSLLIFTLGAGVSIVQGVMRIRAPAPIENPLVSYIVLGLAFLFEGGSWLVAAKQFRRAKGQLGLWQAMRLSKDPPSFMTMLTDSAAMLGLVIAALTTYLSGALHRPDIDGMGSVAIGALLAVTSAFLVRESKSLLIGERAYPAVRKCVMDMAAQQADAFKVNGLITAQLGPPHIVAMLSLEFRDDMKAPEIEKAVLDLEQRVRAKTPEVVGLFIKPQTEKTYQERAERLHVSDQRRNGQ